MGNRHSLPGATETEKASSSSCYQEKVTPTTVPLSSYNSSGTMMKGDRGASKARRNLIARLLCKARQSDDEAPLPQDILPPVDSKTDERQIGMVNGKGATLLRDRPALRLDSRLVRIRVVQHGDNLSHDISVPHISTKAVFQICKYEVISIVGKGSFSQVLRVKDRTTNQFYAVKLVIIENSDFAAVNNELNILSRVRHPFVIRLEEVFRGATKLFIVMELAAGGEMYDRVVGKGRYDEAEARQAMRMLLSGLAYLHSISITHRDLKPENILYSDPTPDARLLITDFGLAHQQQESKSSVDESYIMHDTCGTPEYIAPEILLRVPYTSKVDLWACGVICYILMSGVMPFDDDVRSRLYQQIITANYVYYQEYWSGSELAKDFVDHLLETNPTRRPAASEALKHEWITGGRPPKIPHHKSSAAGQVYKQQNRTASEFDSGMQRTKSTRSIRSVTRSDHSHRVDPQEVYRLAQDLQRLAKKQREKQSTHGSSYQSAKHYGMI